jgi:hypothetical protein
MSTVLEKVKRLEQYVAADENAIDHVVEQTLDKLLERESTRLETLKTTLAARIAAFENQYHMPTREFYPRFEDGALGDAMDFFEWSATYEMLQNLERRISLLEIGD